MCQGKNCKGFFMVWQEKMKEFLWCEKEIVEKNILNENDAE